VGADGTEEDERPRSRTFFYARVSILLLILVGVLGYAWRDTTSRSRRNEWERPLSVAYVVIASEPLEEDVGPRLASRKVALENRIAEQMRRYRAEPALPLLVDVIGPVPLAVEAPKPPKDSGLVSAARYAYDLRGFRSRVDEAAGLDGRRYDSTIYIVAKPLRSEQPKMIEGASQDGGRIGVVSCDIDVFTVDFTLFVATHELFHTLGATDKYGVDRTPVAPDGLADPEKTPTYPQSHAELMAGTRALAPGRAALPRSIEELVVGPVTAREIGWLGER
jgi:hypothetical protein